MDAMVGTLPPAVQWAAEVGPEGVTAWTADRDKAAALSQAAAERVIASYASRPIAGKLELVAAVEAAAEAAKAVEPEVKSKAEPVQPAAPEAPRQEPKKPRR
jgi:hypothetical protein